MARRRNSKKTLLISIVALLLALAQQRGYLAPVSQVAEQNQPGLYRVVTFTDGDTLTVDMNGMEEKIRLIGVDTPETQDPRKEVQCFGKAASDFTKRLISTNKVRLEADPLNTNRDRYNRLLRYMYLPDGRLVNAEIIKQGYGFAYTHFPFSKLDEFKAHQQTASDNGLGLWTSCSVETETNGQVHTGAQ